ncbi:MAG: hypothetical protein VXZ38_13670 [Planctomycetota bacterium]|nr:hypothetical protein [Planctomycetota bacterium]
MTVERRIDDRRRRVLFSANRPQSSAPLALAVEDQDDLRAARRPQEAYGSRVKRRLRSRWFSVVPIHRSRLLLLIGFSLAITLLLCMGHYYAATSSFLLSHPDIARPLKLDQPNSFGRFALVGFTACSIGAVLMIYQLRRYRSDDFGGRYRIWRVAFLVLSLACVHSLVDLLTWGGALIDVAVGRRILLSGEDWIRILLDIGGLTLAIRLFLEVRSVTYSGIFLGIASLSFLISEFTTWGALEINSNTYWMLSTCSALFGVTTLFISMTIFLRKVYREVRGIDAIESVVESASSTSSPIALEHETPEIISKRSSLSAPGRITQLLLPMRLRSFFKRTQSKRSIEAAKTDGNGPSGSKASNTTDSMPASARRSSSKLKNEAQKTSDRSKQDKEQKVNPTPTSRTNPSSSSSKVTKHPSNRSQSTTNQQADRSREDTDLDWSKLSKSERRRLRKQLKRQRRAA